MCDPIIAALEASLPGVPDVSPLDDVLDDFDEIIAQRQVGQAGETHSDEEGGEEEEETSMKEMFDGVYDAAEESKAPSTLVGYRGYVINKSEILIF